MCEPAHRGYTLVEFLVVLGIVALLISILLPIISLARGRAGQAACLGNLNQLHKAFAMYASDHDSFLPPYNNNLINSNGEGNSNLHYFPPRGDLLTASLHSYTKTDGLWFCPEDSYAHRSTPVQATFSIDHHFSSYETSWPLGTMEYPVTIDGVQVKSRHGRTIEIKTDFPMLQDAEEMLTGCSDWAFSHNGRFNSIAFDGHAESVTSTCTP